MSWTLRFHPLVADEDLPSLPKTAQDQILSAIQKRLALDPESYGRPLRRGLSGYWRMRVADYRVVYQIDRGTITVIVVKIGLRRESQVYSEALKRIMELR